MHTDVIRESQAERLLFLNYASYTGNKKEGSIILASMLWSQNTDTFVHLYIFTVVSFVLENKKSRKSFYNLTT